MFTGEGLDNLTQCQFDYFVGAASGLYNTEDIPAPERCVNSMGSYKCICPDGYEYRNKVCADINECPGKWSQIISGMFGYIFISVLN